MTSTLTTSGCFFSFFSLSPLISILVKSRCSKSMGPEASMGTRGALPLSLSCFTHFSQNLTVFLASMVIPGHQNLSSKREAVHFWPWCPTSWWQPSRGLLPMGLWHYKDSSHLCFTLKVAGQVELPIHQNHGMLVANKGFTFSWVSIISHVVPKGSLLIGLQPFHCLPNNRVLLLGSHPVYYMHILFRYSNCSDPC